MSRADHDDELRRLAGLARSLEPPPELEERVVESLTKRGLIRLPTRARGGRWLVAATIVVAALAGWLARGRFEPAAGAPEGRRFLLLLAEPQPLETDKPLAALVEEYRDWAIGLAARQKLEAAARLTGGSRRLSGGGGEVASGKVASGEVAIEDVTGYFLVRADGWAEAQRIAASCPHLSYGGEISIREVARDR